MVTPIKVFYVSLHRFSTLPLSSLAKLTSLTVLGLWTPNKLVQGVFNFFRIVPAKKIMAREIPSNPKNYTLRSSVILETALQLRNKRSTFYTQFISRPLYYFLQRKLSQHINSNEMTIIPADIWDLVDKKLRSKVLLEVRWLTHNLLDTLDLPKQIYKTGVRVDKSTIPELTINDIPQFLGFITYSNIGKESLILTGINSEKILSVPLSYYFKNSLIEISTEKRVERILYVGRSAPDKRVDLAVEISETLKIPIDIVGKFDVHTIEWLTKKSYVNLIGIIPNNDVLRIMKRNKYLVAPGAESWGLAVIEGLNNGMQVFASKYIGAVDWISHRNLFVIPDMSCELFVQKIKLDTENQSNYHFRDLVNESDEIWRKFLKL